MSGFSIESVLEMQRTGGEVIDKEIWSGGNLFVCTSYPMYID